MHPRRARVARGGLDRERAREHGREVRGPLDANGVLQTQRVEVRFFPQEDVGRAGSRIVLIAAGDRVEGPVKFDEPRV